MRARDACCAALAVAFAILGATARAAPYVPPELEPWRAWVLHGEEHRVCPFLFDQVPGKDAAHLCAWPGTLDLEVGAGGGRFAQGWQVYAAGWVPLPGSEQAWPQDVTAGGRPVAATLRDGRPSVWLEAGSHALAGRFTWQRTPGSLAVPPSTALVQLTIDGRTVAWPQRNGDALWISERAAAVAPEADALRIQVHRLFTDGIPFTATSQIHLDVAGTSREELLARALPPGFVATQIVSPLPARIEADGRLRVQLRPGSWQLLLMARAGALPETIDFDPGEGAWADEELWSYQSADTLRVTAPEGANPVDPVQVGMPPEWQAFPAFRVTRGERMSIVEQSRGVPAALENQLTLQRQLWRDYSGAGYTVADQLSGRVETGWRLDMRAPYRLGSATAGGRELLVTRGADETRAGVEVRDRNLSLQATSRIEDAGGRFPATGWEQRFENASVTLHLPRGQRLLAAPGADYAPTTWLQGWRLLDFFLVLFIALAVGRLLSPVHGAAAFGMLVLTYQEPSAPVWIWLVLLLAVALVRFAPEGRLLRAARTLRVLAFLALALVAVPFIATQLRAALYPQLDARSWDYYGPSGTAYAPAPADYDERVVGGAVREMASPAMEEYTRSKVSPDAAAPASAPTPALDYAPSVLVQSGPTVPQWQGVVYELGWSGPVGADDDLRLVILGTFAYRCVRVLGVLLVGWLAFALARASFGALRWPPRFEPGAAAGWLAAGLTLAMLGSAPDVARAETPDPALLQALKERLLEPPECTPRCAEVARASVRIEGDSMAVDLEVAARARVAVPLPGAPRAWEPREVVVDAIALQWLYRTDDQRLWIVVDEGVHSVRLSGPLAELATLRIPFPEPPRQIEVDARGWTVSGVADGRLASGALALERAAPESPQDATEPKTLIAGAIAPYVSVMRTITLGVDWSVVTTVERLAPADGAFTVEVPLVAGESVTSDLPVRDGRVLASFADGQATFVWTSTLAQAERIELAAGAGADAVEVWRVAVGPAWRVTHEGTPLIASGESSWTPEFHPRPGESLVLEVSRPEAVGGPTFTIDSVTVQTTAGQRVIDSTLNIAYHATRGAQHAIRLPAQARVVSVTSDGESVPVRPQDGELTLPIRPGTHRIDVTLQEERESVVLAHTSAIDLGHESGNVSLTLAFGTGRWVLYTTGPRDGPAVLLWGELIVFLLLAPLLARLPGMPLRTRHWVLLGIGFSTFAWGVLALLAVWFLAFAWRERAQLPTVHWRYNAMQLALAVLTIATLLTLLSTILWGALLGQPDMHIVGNGSSASELKWFADRVAGPLPQGSALSLPRWVYQAAILLWALWLSFALLQWLPWAWRAWGRDGIWRGRMKTGPAVEAK